MVCVDDLLNVLTFRTKECLEFTQIVSNRTLEHIRKEYISTTLSFYVDIKTCTI